MCGILACFYSPYSELEFTTALDTMVHRGPDARGVMSVHEHQLGHQRLSILDLSPRSNQPFVLGDDLMIFNGEIYNYKELIQEHNLQPQSSSDTEVLLLMFQKYGKDCLGYLNGMFAFVIYNKVSHEIFAARDRLGIKPLYYREERGKGISFSSEIGALLQLKNSSIDEFGKRQYLKLRMTVGGHTLYQDIRMFPPGHYYGGGQFHQYWSLDNSASPAPEDDELRELITNAVDIRLRSDVPLGTYLSGGLDSTVLSYLAKPKNTWTVGFPEQNEFYWSRLANQDLGSELATIEVGAEEFVALGQKLIEWRREPLSVPNEILIYHMTLAVKKKNTVVLSGEGADELFLGYDRIFRWAAANPEFNLRGFDEKYCYGTHQDDEVLAFALEHIPGKTTLEKVTYYFQIVHLQGLLRRLDNSTMYCSVEARVPFVDHRLVERLAGTPFSWRMAEGVVKAPLKRIFKDLVPAEIIERKKIGFPVPLEQVFTDLSQGPTPMDRWLAFNMNTLSNYQ